MTFNEYLSKALANDDELRKEYDALELEYKSIRKIALLDPHPTEAIVVGFNFDNIHLDDMGALLDYIKSKFPNNTVVAIPDHISLQSCSKDVLEHIISMISEIIDEL